MIKDEGDRNKKLRGQKINALPPPCTNVSSQAASLVFSIFLRGLFIIASLCGFWNKVTARRTILVYQKRD